MHAVERSTLGQHDAHQHSTDNMRWCGCEQCGEGARGEGARGEGAGGEALWRVALWRVALAEGCGTALLVLLTCLPACAADHSSAYRAVTSGLVVAVLVQSLDHVSGAQLNPTVTLAALLWGRVSRTRALAMLCAQMAGACAGGAALQLLQPAHVPALCVTLPAQNLAVYKAVLIEAVLGGCLALVNCASWDARNRGLRDSWPLRIGLAIAGLSLVGEELTGASMNPVRSFAPALWSGTWDNHWVYWVGPLAGSVLFTSVYLCAWRAHTPRCDVTPRDVTAPALCAKTRAEP